MPEDLKLSTQSAVEEEITDKEYIKPKKGSGLSCFLISCLGLLAIVVIPIIATVIYVSTLEEEDYGRLMAEALQNPQVAERVKVEIQQSPELTQKQKDSVLLVYENFLENYDLLTEEQKQNVHRNMAFVVKEAFKSPEEFKKNPPEELNELIFLFLAPENQRTQKTQDLQIQETQENTANQATTSNDPYEFELPDVQENSNPDEPEMEKDSQQYDF